MLCGQLRDCFKFATPAVGCTRLNAPVILGTVGNDPKASQNPATQGSGAPGLELPVLGHGEQHRGRLQCLEGVQRVGHDKKVSG